MKKSAHTIHISVAQQCLTLKCGRAVKRTFPISTSKFGLGTREGSFQTPTGRFRIAEKIGGSEPVGTAFRARVPFQPSSADLAADDLVMTRILWLEGIEPGNANTYDRYIYIHGTNHEDQIGRPASHGCVRMKNADVVDLCRLVEVGTPVIIRAPRRSVARGIKVKKGVAPKGCIA